MTRIAGQCTRDVWRVRRRDSPLAGGPPLPVRPDQPAERQKQHPARLHCPAPFRSRAQGDLVLHRAFPAAVRCRGPDLCRYPTGMLLGNSTDSAPPCSCCSYLGSTSQTCTSCAWSGCRGNTWPRMRGICQHRCSTLSRHQRTSIQSGRETAAPPKHRRVSRATAALSRLPQRPRSGGYTPPGWEPGRTPQPLRNDAFSLSTPDDVSADRQAGGAPLPDGQSS
jgi:hypothetical protein